MSNDSSEGGDGIQLTDRYNVLSNDQEDQVTFLFPWNGFLSLGGSDGGDSDTRDLLASDLLDNSSSGYGSESPASSAHSSAHSSCSTPSSGRKPPFSAATKPSGGLRCCDRPAFHILLAITTLVVVVGVQLVLVAYALTYPTTWTAFNLPNIDISLDAFQVPNHKSSLREDALLTAFKEKRRGSLVDWMTGESVGGQGISQWSYRGPQEGDELSRFRRSNFPPQHTNSWRMEVVYIAQGGGEDSDNIFTEERLETIHQIEMAIMAMPGFSDYCARFDEEKLKADTSLSQTDYCLPINSLLSYFYPSKVDGKLFFDGMGSKQAEISGTLRKAMTHKEFYWFVDENMSAKNPKSKLLRSEVQFGHENRISDYQGFIIHENFKNFVVNYVDLLGKASTDKVKVLYGGTEIFDWEVLQTFYHDEQLAIISLALIFTLVLILTSFSLWLTVWGLLSIVLSFGLAYVLYRMAFRAQAFGILNGVSAFVVIGIGVDDVFVFINTFRQAKNIKRLTTRIIYTLFTAGMATFFTSFTTTAAFAANMLSQIPAIYDFGLFMSLLVSSCWLNVVLIMPSALVLWHYAFFPCENAISISFSQLFRFPKKVAKELVNILTSYEQQNQNIPTVSALSENNNTDDGEGNNNDDFPLLQNDDATLLECEEAVYVPDGDVPLIELETLSERGSSSSSSLRSSVTNGKKSQGFVNIISFLRKSMCKYIASPMILGRYIVIGGYFVILLGCLLAISFLYKPASKPPALYKEDSNLQQLFNMAFNFSSDDISCKRCSGIFLEGPKDVLDWDKPDETPDTSPINILPPTSKPPAIQTTVAGGAIPPRTTLENYPAQVSTKKSSVEDATIPLRLTSAKTLPANSGGEESFKFTGDTVYVVFGFQSDNFAGGKQVLTDTPIDKIVDNGQFDPKFNFSQLSIKHLCLICKSITAKKNLVREGGSHCYPKDPLDGIKSLSGCDDLPQLPENETSKSQYNSTDEGSYYVMAFEMTSNGMSKNEVYSQWKNLIENEIHNSPKYLDLSSTFATCECWSSQLKPQTSALPAPHGSDGGNGDIDGGEEPPLPLPTVESVKQGYDPCLDGSCGQAVNRPILHNGAQIFVVFGIKTIDRSNLTGKHVLDDNMGKVIYDDNFILTPQRSDVFKDLCQMCKNIYSRKDLVKEGGAQCYPSEMKAILDLGLLPKECSDLPEPQLLKGEETLSAAGFKEDGSTLLWYTMAFESTTSEASSANRAYQDFLKWEELIEEERSKLTSDSLKSVYQTCTFWKQVFVELLGVSSAIYGLIFSLVLCTLAIVVFTRHLLLLLIVILTIVGIISSVVALFFVFGWELGAVEAISLAILVGSSVDYCVHLVEGYLITGHNLPNNLTNSKLRQWRAKAAFGHIGVSIVSSAITTIVAAIPLCFATILPFAKFGGIVALNTTVSIIYTLTATTAFLSTFAPARYVGSIKWFLISVFTIVTLLGLMVLVAYCVHFYGHIAVPGPDGNSLF